MFRMLMATAALSLVSASASASTPRTSGDDAARTRFYDFGVMLIDGTVRAPSVDLVNPRGVAIFERMLSLKKALVPGIFEARSARVFK